MLTVTIDQSEGISGDDIPEQVVKKMRTGSAALSLPRPRAFFWTTFHHYLGAWNRLDCPLPHYIVSENYAVKVGEFCSKFELNYGKGPRSSF